jgi:hypothetical protein
MRAAPRRARREEAQISVPCALLQQSPGAALKAFQSYGTLILGTLSWLDIVPHSAPVVAWEFWSNSNDECGLKCEKQLAFLESMTPTVMPMLQARVMTFTPHYITLQCGPTADADFCAAQARGRRQGCSSDTPVMRADVACAPQCINNGRYCQQDPDGVLEARTQCAAASLRRRH